MNASLPTMVTWLCISFLTVHLSHAGRFYPPEETQLPVATPDGIGPLPSLSIHDRPLGYANIYGGKSPDLFVMCNRHTHLDPYSIWLYKFLGRKDGVPVFDKPMKIEYSKACLDYMRWEYTWKGGKRRETVARSLIISQDAGKPIFRLQAEKRVFLTWCDVAKQRFVDLTPDELKSPRAIQMLKPQLLGARLEFTRHSPLIARGHRFGITPVYDIDREGTLVNPRYVVGPDGVILRENVTNSFVSGYPSESGEHSDLIVFGEGGRYYHKFTGRFDRRDQPVYGPQIHMLQKNPPLYYSSLPVINTVDWDGDGDIDVVAGDSVGFVGFIENTGTTEAPRFLPAVKLRANNETIRIRPGAYGSIQGPGEANWGYTCPTVIDWNGDGLLDVMMSSAVRKHAFYPNIGTAKNPKLGSPRDLFCNGLDLHGAWRVKAGVGRLNGKMAYIILNEEKQFHLYWQYDARNCTDGGVVKLEDGTPIALTPPAEQGGRAKLALEDWDGDGKNDLLVTGVHLRQVLYPGPMRFEKHGLVLLLKNVSTEDRIRFARPLALAYRGNVLSTGCHSRSAAQYPFADGMGVLLTVETGRFFLLRPGDISWVDPAK